MVLGMLIVYTSKSSATHLYVILNDYLIIINQKSSVPNPYCQDWCKVFNFIHILVKYFVKVSEDYKQKLG